MTAANPYLLGNYAPVGAEETVTGLPVPGASPRASTVGICATAPIRSLP